MNWNRTMGNEESREVPKHDTQSANTKIHATSHYQSPTANFNSPYPAAPTYNQQQAHQPGWIMSQPPPNNPNAPSQNTIYPNLPPSYNTIQHTTKQAQPSVPQQPSAPPMFYPQAPTQANHFYAQPSVGSSVTQTPNVLKMTPASSFNPHPIKPNDINGIWSKATTRNIPPNSFRAGHDTDGTAVFICRASHGGDIVPGKLIPSHSCAYICHDGKEIPKNEFETLIGNQYNWVSASNGHVPPYAVEGGRTARGEKLYIGRVSYNRSLTTGKIHPSHGCLYIPYGGEEHSFKQYEVLVHSN